MRYIGLIVCLLFFFGCDSERRESGDKRFVLRDTTVTTNEWYHGLLVFHFVSYDSTGQVSFQTEQVAAFDTVAPSLSFDDGAKGRSFHFGAYEIRTMSTSNDTFEVMIDSVRTGRFLCMRDKVVMKDAQVIERRAIGYGKYENSGFLVVPNHHDTVPIWSFLDPGLSQPIIWNWEEHSPMTWEEYQADRDQMKQFSARLTSGAQIDSMIAAGK